jgi:hypothetical protein
MSRPYIDTGCFLDKWCLYHARFVYIYAFYVEFACLLRVLCVVVVVVVWLGYKAELAKLTLHYVMRRL